MEIEVNGRKVNAIKLSINGKEFIVRELFANEVDIMEGDNKAVIKKQIMIASNLTEEDYNNLTWKEKMALIKASNEVNGLEDFQKPIEIKS